MELLPPPASERSRSLIAGARSEHHQLSTWTITMNTDADGPLPNPNLSPPIIKSITLIRHGVALHNICDEMTGAKPNVLDPKFTDSPLTRHGELQAVQLGERLKRIGLVRCYHEDSGRTSECSTVGCRSSSDADTASPIEMVVCSPLTRCLQTASHIFPSYFRNSHPPPDTTSTDVHVLNRNCTVCCHPDVREAYGKNYSDKRR